MRTADEIMKDARDEVPFSNGTSWEIWSANWCWAPCHTPAEKAWQDYEAGKRKNPHKDYPSGCPLIQCALIGKTPVEWLEQPGSQDYHCIEFRGPDDGRGEPRPKPEPPGMDGLFDRPERGVRMLQQSDADRLSAAVLAYAEGGVA